MVILNYLISIILGFLTAWFGSQHAPVEVSTGAGLTVTWLAHKYLDPIFLSILGKFGN